MLAYLFSWFTCLRIPMGFLRKAHGSEMRATPGYRLPNFPNRPVAASNNFLLHIR
jgi:hypothetical protein